MGFLKRHPDVAILLAGVALILFLLVVAGCRSTIKEWSLHREGDGFVAKCTPLPGHDTCGMLFDIPGLEALGKFVQATRKPNPPETPDSSTEPTP